jgi:hypothetical protein
MLDSGLYSGSLQALREVGQMTTKWLYTQNGEPAFYQQGEYLYAASDGDCRFVQKEAWFFEMDSGQALYFQSGEWLFTPDGKPALYYG